MASIKSVIQLAQSAGLRLGRGQSLPEHDMTTVELREGEKPAVAKLSAMPRPQDTGVVVTFEPSAFGGKRDAKQLTLSMSVPCELAGEVLCLEARVKELLREEHPNVDEVWRSAISDPTEKAPLTLRCKVYPDSVEVFGEDKQRAELEEWRGRAANAVLHAKGVYVRDGEAQRSIGLQLACSHIQLSQERVLVRAPLLEVANPFG